MIEKNNGENGLTRRWGRGVGLRDGLTYFLIGGGVGAVLALLFAPKAGNEMRADIAEVSRKGYDATREKAIDLKDQSADVINAVKEKADAVYDFASRKLSSGSEAISEVVAEAAGTFNDGIEPRLDKTGSSAKRPDNGRKGPNFV